MAVFLFQSLSGLSLGLNRETSTGWKKSTRVSIPFRAVTGFEPRVSGLPAPCARNLFQSLSGLSLGLNCLGRSCPYWATCGVSIPFRAVTGFELALSSGTTIFAEKFQSLSGLSLGLNRRHRPVVRHHHFCFNPFQGCHWV